MKHKMDAYLKELRCNIGGLSRCKMGMSNRASGSVSSTIHMFPGVFRSEMSTFIWILAWAFAGSILREDLWHKEPCCCRNSCADRMDKLLLLTIHSSLPVQFKMLYSSMRQSYSLFTLCWHWIIKSQVCTGLSAAYQISHHLNNCIWMEAMLWLSCLRSLEKLRLYGPLPGRWTMDMSLQEVDPINSNPVTISIVDVILDDAETPKLCYWLLCSFLCTEQFYRSVYRSSRLQSSSPFFVEAKKSNKLFTNLKTVTMRYRNYMGACTDLLPMGAGAEFLNFWSHVLQRFSLLH
ncbi:hypothetical protein Droror1_Dr00016021 [Drosera rotundifolia]